jgi:PAS domain S-box-containing protein
MEKSDIVMLDLRTNEQLGANLNTEDQQLYVDLANALPSGMYRLRVSREVSLLADNWLQSIEALYKIEFVNDRFCEILQIDKDALLKNAGIIVQLIHKDDKADFAEANVAANLNMRPFNWEGRFVVDGKTSWISMRSIPRKVGNNEIVWTGILDDITERKQTEEQLRLRNEELLKLNSDKDRFMSILAHDLKSPFNAILGLLELLLSDIREYDIDEIEEQLTMVKRSAHSAFNLLEDILLWARSHLGKIPFQPTDVDFMTCTGEMVDLMRSCAVKKDISIRIEEPEDIILRADMGMLKTIIRNLLSNAIKFTPSGGQITIKANRNHENVVVSVCDNGVGISDETMSKLFNITKVYSSPGTAGETGTGLGLLLCKEFVDMHHGTIWVDSELGKGSTFSISLPLS